MLTLHYAPNTISIVVAIALHEAGLEFDTVKVDFATAQQTKPEYLAINPKARVPALIVGEEILTETGAILEWIADTTGKMRSHDPMEALRMRELMYYLAGTMHVNHAHRMRGSRWADQESSYADMQAKVPQTMAASAAYLENTLAFAPFAVGSELTLADPYLFMILCWLDGDGVDIRKTPKVAAFWEMMNARDSVQKARAAGMIS